MANKTVYPYGTGGSLPSSIGLINDLTTGGVDKALTAEQGKVVGDFLQAIDSVLPKASSDPPGREDADLTGVDFYNKAPGGTSMSTRVVTSTLDIPEMAAGLHMKVASGYYAIIYFLRANGTWDSNVDSSGAFNTECYCARPDDYNSAGVWLYFRKGDGTGDITTTEARSCITELYWDVPDEYYLPVATKDDAKKSISILFIGNSLTQDAVSYVPYLIRNLYPSISFKFYMWYNGGYTLEQQYTKFTSNGKAEIFSVCENATGWTNSNNSVTMASVLSTYRFDIVCLQEYFNYKTTYTDATDFDNCVSYIKSNYPREFKVVTFFHAPLRSSADTVYERTKAGNELILKRTIAESLIAPGVAVYRALSTSLDSLGDQSHLSPDGTHTQEGLPCLLQAFVVYMWILRQLSIPVSVANCKLRMTTAIYNTINVPGPNLGSGVIEGTSSQNDLAQDVAIKADEEGQGIQAGAFISMTS